MRCKIKIMLVGGLLFLASHAVATAQTPVTPSLHLQIKGDYHLVLDAGTGQERSGARTGVRPAPVPPISAIEMDLHRILLDLKELKTQLHQGHRQPNAEEALLRALQDRAKAIEQQGKEPGVQPPSRPMPPQWQIVPNPGIQPLRFQVEPSGGVRRSSGTEGNLERKLDLILWELTELRREMTSLKERPGKGLELHFQLQPRPGSPMSPWQMKEFEKKSDSQPRPPQPGDEVERLRERRQLLENLAKMQQQQAQEELRKAQQQRQKAIQHLQNLLSGDGNRPVDPPPTLEQILQRIMHELDDLRREVKTLKSQK